MHALPTSPALPADCAAGASWGWLAGRFFSVCYFEPAAPGSSVTDESCRPVACRKDDDCPWAQFGSGTTFVCNDGVCQSDSTLGADVDECLWKLPRPSSCHCKVGASPGTFVCGSDGADGGVYTCAHP